MYRISMPRKTLIRTKLYPYHVVSRSNHKWWFSCDLSEVWKISISSLAHAQSCYPVNLHAFVLMQNHYHLLLDTPNEDIDSFMYEFNKMFSLLLRKKTRLINRMFGGRYKWSLVKDDISYWYVLRYIFQNPVAANICQNVFDYPYSSIRHSEMISKLKFKPFVDILNKKNLSSIKNIFNQEQREIIQRALYRSEFKINKKYKQMLLT